MAGIYIHIPFCKKACHYCDFHFSTSLKLAEDLTTAICKEIELRKHFFKTKIETVYFGGGTPSILPNQLLKKIFNSLQSHFDLTNVIEFTFEANPDDINQEKLSFLKDNGVNRISIGIQSFDKKNLEFLNRVHNEKEALTSIELTLQNKFELSIDLIYGIHSSTLNSWQNDLETFSQFPINHLSSYCLTIEKDTVFGNWLDKKKIDEVKEDKVIEQYNLLQDFCEKENIEQYEISNYAKDRKYAVHNSNYWKQKPYLGIGPSAHSYDIDKRYFNISQLPEIKENDVVVVKNNKRTVAILEALKSTENIKELKENETIFKVLRVLNDS